MVSTTTVLCYQVLKKAWTYTVLRIWHCVEWSYCQWVLIQDVEVSVILEEKVTGWEYIQCSIKINIKVLNVITNNYSFTFYPLSSEQLQFNCIDSTCLCLPVSTSCILLLNSRTILDADSLEHKAMSIES